MLSTALPVCFEVFLVWAIWMGISSLKGSDVTMRQILGKLSAKL